MKRAPIVTAAVCTALLWLAQFLLVHFKYGDNWTAIYYTGAYTAAPPVAAGEEIYRFAGAGYDGQFYHFIAHDPWVGAATKPFVDNPRLRWRRILVPGLAWAVALGQADFVDSAYDGVMLAFVFLGVYWMARLGYAAAWGAAFLAVPAVLISLERGTVDVALAALCVGFAWYVERDSRLIYPVLARAPLARETGICLIAAFGGVQLWRRSWRRAALGLTMGLPFLAWNLYLNSHTARDLTSFASLVPLRGLVMRTLHPVQFALSSGWLKKAAALDYVALLGIWIALAFAAYCCSQDWLGILPKVWGSQSWLQPPFRWLPKHLPNPNGRLKAGCGQDSQPHQMHLSTMIAFALVAVFLAQPQAWDGAYTFGRTLSPLLIFAALIAVRERHWWGLAPLAASLPRILFQLWTVIKAA